VKTEHSPTTEERYRVQSVERAFELLEALTEAPSEGMTLSALARSLGVSKSTAYAILQTLLAGGFVADAGAGMSRRYRLGMALARLGDIVVSQIALRDVAMPVIRDLTAETGLTSRLAVLDDAHAIVIARVDAPQGTVRFTSNLGKREHLHCSAVGKSMLATLPQAGVDEIVAAVGLPQKTPHTIADPSALRSELAAIKSRGYAIDDEEDAEGVFCVGSAVFDRSGRCAGAVSVTGLKLDLPAWRVDQIGGTVRSHAARISELLGAPSDGGEKRA